MDDYYDDDDYDKTANHKLQVIVYQYMLLKIVDAFGEWTTQQITRYINK